MLQWSAPKLQDFERVRECTRGQDIRVSDLSFANLFLLQEKYHIKIAFHRGFLLRHYEGTRAGFAFPAGNGNPMEAVEALLPLHPNWILLTREQVAWLNGNFPGRYAFTCDMGDWDYLYARESLANLSGKKYEKKRNHISRFQRALPDCRFVPLTEATEADALTVAQGWLTEHENTQALQVEIREIEAAMAHRSALGLLGGILYVGDKPVGITVASEISPGVLDVHFEKVLESYARLGGYAVINRAFAGSVSADWLNREEDINLTGLRKAKLSYQPTMLLEKYSAREICDAK